MSFPRTTSTVKPPPWLDAKQRSLQPPPFVRPSTVPPPDGDDAYEAEPLVFPSHDMLDGAARDARSEALKSVLPFSPEVVAESAARASMRPPSAMPQRPSSMAPRARSTRPPSLAPGSHGSSVHAEAFSRAISELAASQKHVFASAERSLLALSIAIAEALVERELRLDPAIHVTLARAAIDALGPSDKRTVRASSDAYAALVAVGSAPELDCEGEKLAVLEDAELEGLGVVVETHEARVDGRVTERLRSVLRALDDERGKTGSDAEEEDA